MEVKAVDIHIENESSIAHITVSYESGRVESYDVNDMDFLSTFNGCYKKDASRIGPLPDGFIDASYSNSDNFAAIIEVPAGIKSITYYGDVFFIPFPALLFSLEISEGKVSKSSVVATENGFIYHYPFGNVYENGKICWGSTVLPTIHCLKDVEQIISIFFGSETNNDLYEAGRNIVNKPQYINQRGLLQELVGKRKFPKKILIPISPWTKEEFIKNVL